MIVKLLRVDSSPFGAAALSRRLTSEFVDRWRVINPRGSIIPRDLTTTTIPVIDAAWVSANYTPTASRTPEQNKLLKLSTQLIGELAAADECVIGIAMHNWGPPSSFKLWVDQIVTPSTLLERLLAGKRATVIVAAGRVYRPGSPDAPKNYLVPWLRSLFGSLGMKEMQFVIADGTKDIYAGKTDREAFIAPHLQAVRALFAQDEIAIERMIGRGSHAHG
jgi:FMN-dependent NADH-azoreductase